jgi:aspartate aminotransferase
MFEKIEKLPDDPILGILTSYRNDDNPKKIDLSVGVYKDEDGLTPIFDAVKKAESKKLSEETSKTYTSIEGDPVFCEFIQKLVLGDDHVVIKEKRSGAVSTPGGSGALRVAGEVINGWKPGTNLWVSTPSWPNHIPLLGTAGLTVKEYPYYDGINHVIKTDEMLTQISKLTKDDILLLHACCHNPSGADLDFETWKEITTLAQKNGFTPFVDCAYQGLGMGLDADVEGLRYMASHLPELIIAYSCSKNFGLYRERVGSTIIITENPSTTDAAWTHMKSVARRLYSVPPAHGAIIVGMILGDKELKNNWKAELDQMQQNINTLRGLFTDNIQTKSENHDFNFVKSQCGMFSILGLTVEQVIQLREEFSIYMVNNSRINIAGVSETNIDYLTDSIATVL